MLIQPKRWFVAAAMGAMALGVVAQADDVQPGPAAALSQLSLTPQYASEGTAAPAPTTLLMSALEPTPIGQALEAARINIYGHIEGSYTYNFMNPAKDLNLGRVFDIKANDPEVNQTDLNIERTVDLASHQFDIGGRLELLYGTDARFTHSNGLFDYENFFHGPEYQFDIPQMYIDVALPVGNGLRIRFGKFVFFKQIDPNASVFYSHSFAFGAAFPFTLSGVSGLYIINDQWNVEAGISRGWDQSTKDNNGAIDGFVRVRFAPTDRTSFSLAAITGPEDDNDNSHYRQAVDLTVTHALTDNLTFLSDSVFGNDAAGSPEGTNANWYGTSGYLVYKLTDQFSVAGRAEWYRDEEAFTTGVAQNLYEATIGLTITPFPNNAVVGAFKVRPEIRYDYSSRDFFNGLTRHDELTAAVDAIFNF